MNFIRCLDEHISIISGILQARNSSSTFFYVIAFKVGRDYHEIFMNFIAFNFIPFDDSFFVLIFIKIFLKFINTEQK